ncbi:hypothetical protein DPMN_124659 [Dreissena polymorpha]|uniref:Uncharacterized protein n=1 Tax=Dreissena polymorpha TaxID=45954 RepID=A0A9D4GTY6_DREPO|nr:hypothetical protein DPMN_124659 [Dreissena polymorpha]
MQLVIASRRMKPDQATLDNQLQIKLVKSDLSDYDRHESIDRWMVSPLHVM